MFEIRVGNNGEIIPSGRFDASQSERVSKFLEEVTESRVLDLKELDYISSSGLGILVHVQQRLKKSGEALRIVNANPQVRDIFRFSGLAQLFEIE